MRRIYSTKGGDEKQIEPESKRPLGRPRHRLENKSSTDLKETGHESADWIQLSQDRN
jgi:hypothetical protein